MSMYGDIINTFRKPVAEGKLDIETAACMFISVLSALEWDLEEAGGSPSDCVDYLEEEFKIAIRILSK